MTLTKMIAIPLVALLFVTCTVVRIGEEKEESEDQYATWTKTGTGFQASDYVDAVWDEQVVPTFEQDSVDFETLFQALEDDRAVAIKTFGLTRQTGEPFTVFKVKGSATVLEFDDSSRNGVIRVDIDSDGVADTTLQVGPVLRGTAIRDALEFIRFTDIGNQLQYADLAKELNNRMHLDSVEPLDLQSIAGKRISFLGAFRLESDEPLHEIVVTPVRILLQDD